MAQQIVEKAPATSKTSQYGFIAFALGLGLFIWWVRSDPNPPPTRPAPEMVKGAVIDAPITLVTSDRNDLACVLPNKDVEGGYHCEFVGVDKPWAESASENVDRKKLLAPYKTIDDALILIPGLFEEPAVAERYQDEIPNPKNKDKLARFTAQCKVKLTTEVENVMVRWNPKGQWQGPHKVFIGIASNCQVSEP
ncbi:MAG: hypothetical protein HY898_28415 [Deltaproteobacteria bacterium]|nr:hypothetical protein [Deltaproteobacteria bacterium]